jgi:hypothetical protein
LSGFFKWFLKEIESMPTSFAECNENITYYTLIGIFQMLAGEGCEHVPELKKAGSFLRCFDSSKNFDGNRQYSKKAHEELVECAWPAILYVKNRGREPGELRYILFIGDFVCASSNLFVLVQPEADEGIRSDRTNKGDESGIDGA